MFKVNDKDIRTTPKVNNKDTKTTPRHRYLNKPAAESCRCSHGGAVSPPGVFRQSPVKVAFFYPYTGLRCPVF